MKRIIYTLLILLSAIVCFGQKRDTSEILFNAKLKAINWGNYLLNVDALKNLPDILKDTVYFKSEILKTSGFQEVMFIELTFPDANLGKLMILPPAILNDKEEVEKEIGKMYYFDFVIAYFFKTSSFYSIKGFVSNEFSHFYADYHLMASSNEQRILSKKHLFIENYTIDGVDLECLFRSINKPGKKVNYKTNPCLIPNTSRMVMVNGFPVFY